MVHDYAGHPFQWQLSKAMARRGLRVVHAYFAACATPQAEFIVGTAERDNLRVEPVSARAADKQSVLSRLTSDWSYARAIASVVRAYAPRVVLSGNAPLPAQKEILKEVRRLDSRCVFWLQDIISRAGAHVLRRKIGSVLAWPLVRAATLQERHLVRSFDGVVAVSEDFLPWIESTNAGREDTDVIENWAPVEEIPVVDKSRSVWAREHDLEGKFVFLYSGTLGFKHRPEYLLQIAREFRADPSVRVVVNTEGAGADWLRQRAAEEGLDNIQINGFQSFSQMPDVMGAADVLVAILEESAGAFSVPSKVLTYHCSGRPILLIAPRDNLAVRIVDREVSGWTVDVRTPGEEDLPSLLDRIRNDESERHRRGKHGRAYAERAFEIESITDRFLKILEV